ncbi:Uncharacterised protein [Mycobacteroides abscessus subsp. abscessus]|nr:Uncharacterised protein [Mycobacteroides abscessus subsp. abscessus]
MTIGDSVSPLIRPASPIGASIGSTAKISPPPSLNSNGCTWSTSSNCLPYQPDTVRMPSIECPVGTSPPCHR